MKPGESMIVLALILIVAMSIVYFQDQIKILDARITNIEMAK